MDLTARAHWKSGLPCLNLKLAAWLRLLSLLTDRCALCVESFSSAFWESDSAQGAIQSPQSLRQSFLPFPHQSKESFVQYDLLPESQWPPVWVESIPWVAVPL